MSNDGLAYLNFPKSYNAASYTHEDLAWWHKRHYSWTNIIYSRRQRFYGQSMLYMSYKASDITLFEPKLKLQNCRLQLRLKPRALQCVQLYVRLIFVLHSTVRLQTTIWLILLTIRVWKRINSLLASGDFCRLRIVFENSLDPDQDRQNVGLDLVPNHLTLW